MTLPNQAHLPFAKTLAPPLLLEHELRTLANTQRRLAGRVALVPAVDLAAYRFRALVDWIEFQVHFARDTQVKPVQEVLRRFLSRNSHISPLDERPGKVFSACRVRVQEPPDMATITAILAALADRFGEASAAQVTGIEVSIDAYPRTPDDLARAVLLGAMQRTIWSRRDIWSNPDSRPRWAFGKHRKGVRKLVPPPSPRVPERLGINPGNHQAPAIDATMYLGAKTDPLMIRIMDKVIDTQRDASSFTALAEDRKRVRIEVTLSGAELAAFGLTDIASLRRFQPGKLHRHFQFKLPTFAPHRSPLRPADAVHNERQNWRARTYLETGVLGLMQWDAGLAEIRAAGKPALAKLMRQRGASLTGKPPGRKTRSLAGKRLGDSFVVWEEMSRAIFLALANLEKREDTAWRKHGHVKTC